MNIRSARLRPILRPFAKLAGSTETQQSPQQKNQSKCTAPDGTSSKTKNRNNRGSCRNGMIGYRSSTLVGVIYSHNPARLDNERSATWRCTRLAATSIRKASRGLQCAGHFPSHEYTRRHSSVHLKTEVDRCEEGGTTRQPDSDCLLCGLLLVISA